MAIYKCKHCGQAVMSHCFVPADAVTVFDCAPGVPRERKETDGFNASALPGMDVSDADILSFWLCRACLRIDSLDHRLFDEEREKRAKEEKEPKP